MPDALRNNLYSIDTTEQFNVG